MFEADVQWREIRVGRHALEVPAVMIAEAQERTYMHVSVRELVRADDGAAEALWAEQRAEVDALPAPPGQAPVIEASEPRPGLKQMIYFSSEYNPERVRLVALLDPRAAKLEVTAEHFRGDPDVLVLFELDGFVDVTGAMARMVLRTANAYRMPRPPGTPPPAPPRLYLAHGSLAVGFVRREHARAELEHLDEAGERALLVVENQARGESPPTGLIDDTQDLVAAARGDLDMQPLGSGSRRVAGVRGEEVRLRIDSPGQRGFLFAFKHAESELHPELSLRWTSGGTDLAAVTAIWERILGSVRRVG